MTLDFTTDAFEANLPQAGRHLAVAEDVKIITSQNDVSYLIITWRLDSGQAVEQMSAIDAAPEHPQYGKTAEGKRLIQKLCEVASIEPKFKTYDDITAAFMGIRAEITLAHAMKQGMRVPAVRAVRKEPEDDSPSPPAPTKMASKNRATKKTAKK